MSHMSSPSSKGNETLSLPPLSHIDSARMCIAGSFRTLTRCIHATLFDALINVTSFLQYPPAVEKILRCLQTKGPWSSLSEQLMGCSWARLLSKTMTRFFLKYDGWVDFSRQFLATTKGPRTDCLRRAWTVCGLMLCCQQGPGSPSGSIWFQLQQGETSLGLGPPSFWLKVLKFIQ